jgi:hypothetical protein
MIAIEIPSSTMKSERTMIVRLSRRIWPSMKSSEIPTLASPGVPQ